MKPSLLSLTVSALLLGGVAHAEDGHNRLRVHFSKSSETDLATVVVGDYQRSPENNYLVGATWYFNVRAYTTTGVESSASNTATKTVR